MKFSAFILILISQLSFAQNVKLKTGDLIFQSMNCGPYVMRLIKLRKVIKEKTLVILDWFTFKTIPFILLKQLEVLFN
jgi:hypothetical protein